MIEKLTMGTVALISRDPVKPDRPSSGPMFAIPTAEGAKVCVVDPRTAPVELVTVNVITAGVAVGFA